MLFRNTRARCGLASRVVSMVLCLIVTVTCAGAPLSAKANPSGLWQGNTRGPAYDVPPTPGPAIGIPGDGSQTFPETGKTVTGLFLDYWNTHGGLAQQGFPISDVMSEVSDLDGKTYTVQYFERAVFEYHPENAPPYNVLLSQLGTFQYKNKYPG